MTWQKQFQCQLNVGGRSQTRENWEVSKWNQHIYTTLQRSSYKNDIERSSDCRGRRENWILLRGMTAESVYRVKRMNQ